MGNQPYEHGRFGSGFLNPVVLSVVIVAVIGMFCFHIYTLSNGHNVFPVLKDDPVAMPSDKLAIHREQIVYYPVQYPDSGRRRIRPAHPPY